MSYCFVPFNSMDMTNLIRTDSSNTDFVELVKLLDEDLRLKDGDDHAFYAQFNKIDAIKNVLVAYVNNKAVGCGAFKPSKDHSVEIKRMFVHPDYRGKGIAQQILAELEKWAADLGNKNCVLETGQKQPEAIKLYLKSGYVRIPNYGQYANVANSVCMQKLLS
jgi:putative acetyltransferase